MRQFQNPEQESRRFSKRTAVCASFVIVFFLIILVRLFYLQIIAHRMYATLSKHNIISVIPAKPARGLIYDRHGVLLAKNIPVYSLMLIPGRIDNMKKTITGLTSVMHLTPDEIKNFYHVLKRYRRYQLVPLRDSLTEKQIAQFYVNQYRFPGVLVERNMLRHYPLGKVMSNVLGYVGRINASELATVDSRNYTASDFIGKSGIEIFDEELLHGKLGIEEAEINASGETVRILKKIAPTPGQNVYLTIDSKLQAFAQKALGKDDGAIVAIAPATGQVLALATNPSFDANAFVTGMSQAHYQKLLKAPGHPLFNRAIRGLYAPGSTVKPFTAFYALNNDVITPKDRIFDPGWFRVPNTKHIFHDWKLGGHGWVNVDKALTISCDTFFYKLAYKLGIKRLDSALESFGFGRKTGINLPGERAGILPTPHWKSMHNGHSWYTGDTILTEIGQGFMLSTPLQLAQATATLAEKGRIIQPTLLLKTQAANGVITPMPLQMEGNISIKNKNAWKVVTDGMHAVVANPVGTAWAFGRHPAYSVAAKTGTAQVFGTNRDEERSRANIPKKLRNNHLFIAFAPINHPQIAIAIVIEHTSFADHIARRVMDYYFKIRKRENHANTNSQQH